MINRAQKNQNAVNLFLNTYFNAILAAGLIIFLAAAYIFFLGPKFSTTQATINANIEEQQNLEAISRQKLANLKALAEVYKKINPTDLQKFNSVLPDEYAPERLFGELEEIVSRGGWLLSGIDISQVPAAEIETSANPKLGKINLTLSLSAIDYVGVKSLLKMLENNLRLFDITSVNFSSTADNASLVLTTYYYKTAP